MSHPDVSQLNAEQLRALTASLFSRLAEQESSLKSLKKREESRNSGPITLLALNIVTAFLKHSMRN
jgi:hypothetical protein